MNHELDMKRMNNHMKGYYPNVMLIAEDSSDFPGVTKSPDVGGLGFDYKWDLGWMNDTLKYMKLNPEMNHELDMLEYSILKKPFHPIPYILLIHFP